MTESTAATSGKKLRVLFLTQWFDPEPGAIRGLPLAKWFVEQGHEVEVVTGVPNYPGGKVYDGYKIRFRQRENIDGVSILRVPLYPSHDQSAIPRILNYLSFAFSAATIGAFSVSRADVCFTYSPPPTVGVPSLIYKWFRRMPFVYHIADLWPDSAIESGMLGTGKLSRFAHRVLTWWCNVIYKQAAAVTVLSDTMKQMLIDRGVPAEKIHVVYNWADEELFKPLPRDERLAAELNLSPENFNLVYAGNFGVFQNLEVAIRAAVKIKDQAPNFRLILIGTGTEEQRLKDLIDELKAENVQIHGRRPYNEMPAISALSDAMLVHLSDEPFLRCALPSKTQIGLAMGIPTLMASSSDASLIIDRANAGIVCEPDNIDAMAASMAEFASLDGAALQKMGESGLTYYHENISLERGGQLMEAIFRAPTSANPKR
ncbi:MAG: glycosyltransferase family 4 protein [Gammaproteobacteria bacterium]